MKHEGPPLELLTHRLAETPADFLAEPRLNGTGSVSVAAVVHDLLLLRGGRAAARELAWLSEMQPESERNRQALALVLCWLLAEPWFGEARLESAALLQTVEEISRELGGQAAARKCIQDPDRREELARLALARLEYRPSGETPAQAQDRLTSISSVERARVLAASREAEKRARAIREQLMRKRAEESADKWTRE